MTRIARGGALLALVVLASLALAGPAAAEHRNRQGADARALPKPWAKKFKARAAKADPDRDGLTNWGEWRAHTKPRRADSDRDGVADAAEDFDRDALGNGAEEEARTDPRRRDTDRDGTRDGAEDPDRDGLANAGEALTEHDPRDPDTDGDGTGDGDENGGVVTAADGATVTIALAAGGTLTAALDADAACADGDDDADVDLDEDPWDGDGLGDDEGDDEDASTFVSASLAEEGDEHDPLDEEWEDDCAGWVEPGAIVHEAEVEDGVLVAIELVEEG
jgi:hypothetical protein